MHFSHVYYRRFHTHFFVVFLPIASTSSPCTPVPPPAALTLESPPSKSINDVITAQHKLPTSDGELEVLSARFVHPSDALAAFHSRQIALMPPQYYLLYTLGHSHSPTPTDPSEYPYEGMLSTRENTPAQREAVRRLADGAFGRMVVNPHPVDQPRMLGESGQEDEGKVTNFIYEGDETRGGPKGRLHRSVMYVRKGGVSILFALAFLVLVLDCKLMIHLTTKFVPNQVIQDIKLHRNFDIFTEIMEEPSSESTASQKSKL